MSPPSVAPPSHGDVLSVVAAAVEPLLNRLVFSGRHVAQFLVTGPHRYSKQTAFAADGTVQALSEASLDRVAADLQRLGLVRGSRTATAEVWSVNSQVALEVVHVPPNAEDAATTWLQYATLLTITARVDTFRGALLIRLTGAPALVALDWNVHRVGGQNPFDSTPLADLLRLIAGRDELVGEVLAAPPEVRAFIRGEARRFLAFDGAELVVQAALPRPHRSRSVVARVSERLRHLAA